jgi:hypothetical protein
MRRDDLLLIDAGASLGDVARIDLFHMALISPATIQVLIDHNIVLSDLRDNHGLTLLYFVVQNRPHHLDLLRMLVNVDGIDLEARTNTGRTCTELAVAMPRVDVLRILLSAGADVNSPHDAQPLLHKSLDPHVFEFELPCTMLLLAAGADVAVRDGLGDAACDWAARHSDSKAMSAVHALVAAGADLDAVDAMGESPRRRLAVRGLFVDPEQVENARREISKLRLEFVRHRALQICIGLQSRGLDALQMCEILVHACGPLARLIAFHQWWTIATTVKHFKR